MAIHVALLRGINVGGNCIVPMAGLRELMIELGFESPRTLLQSGNVAFGAEARKARGAIEKTLESSVQKRFGAPISVLVRTAVEWNSIVERNPFTREAKADPSRLVVMTMRSAPVATAVASLRAGYAGPESIAVDGTEAYLYYPDGIGRSKLTNVMLEKKLGTVGTARNWNTVLKLADVVNPSSRQ